MKYLKGIILVAVGLFFIYWAQAHPPTEDLLIKISNEIKNTYSLPEPWYYATLVAGSVLTLFGIIRLYKDMK